MHDTFTAANIVSLAKMPNSEAVRLILQPPPTDLEASAEGFSLTFDNAKDAGKFVSELVSNLQAQLAELVKLPPQG